MHMHAMRWQIHNRDLSVLVLEEFVALWREELASLQQPSVAPAPAAAGPSAAAAPGNNPTVGAASICSGSAPKSLPAPPAGR